MKRRKSLRVLAPALILGALSLPAQVLPQGTDGYNPTERPDPAGTPTRVEIGLFLLDLPKIDDLNQEFTVDLYVTASWRDSRLAQEGADERLLPMASIWHPALGAVNRRDISSYLPETARVDSAGGVLVEQRLSGEFSSSFDLEGFPADEQVLTVRLASYHHGPDELEIEIAAGRTGRLERLSLAGWEIGPAESRGGALEVPSGTRAGAVLSVTARRETGYYRLTLGLPMVLIALMAWAVFWIDPSYMPSQVSVSTASIFTLIAFRLSLSGALPPVSYLTTADWFILAVTLLVFGAFGEAVWTGGLAKSGREDLARRVDRWARWIYLLALALVCLVSL